MPTTYAPRKLIIVLPDDDFRRLAQLAEDETRTPDQQAQHLVRQGLRRGPPDPAAACSAAGANDAQ